MADKKNKSVKVYLTEEDEAKIRAYCEDHGMKIAEMMRRAAIFFMDEWDKYRFGVKKD